MLSDSPYFFSDLVSYYPPLKYTSLSRCPVLSNSYLPPGEGVSQQVLFPPDHTPFPPPTHTHSSRAAQGALLAERT